jgi:hypothetical protein
MLAQLRRSLKRSAKRSANKTRKARVTRKGKRDSKKKSKQKSKGRKGQLNPYMKALQKARKSNAPEFSYGGKTYKQKKTKTGMTIYARK